MHLATLAFHDVVRILFEAQARKKSGLMVLEQVFDETLTRNQHLKGKDPARE